MLLAGLDEEEAVCPFVSCGLRRGRYRRLLSQSQESAISDSFSDSCVLWTLVFAIASSRLAVKFEQAGLGRILERYATVMDVRLCVRYDWDRRGILRKANDTRDHAA